MDQSKNASDRMIELMTTEELDDRIPRHLPDGIHIAHKTANWDNATHDGDIARIAFDYLEP